MCLQGDIMHDIVFNIMSFPSKPVNKILSFLIYSDIFWEKLVEKNLNYSTLLSCGVNANFSEWATFGSISLNAFTNTNGPAG